MNRMDGEAQGTAQAEQRPAAAQANATVPESPSLGTRLLQKKVMRRALQRRTEGEGGQQGKADGAGGQDWIDRGEKAVAAGKTSFRWTPAESVDGRARSFDFDDADANAALRQLIEWDGSPENLLEAPTGGTGVPHWLSTFRAKAAKYPAGSDKQATLALHLCDAVEKRIAAGTAPPKTQDKPQDPAASAASGPAQTKGEKFRDELYKGAKNRLDHGTTIVDAATIKAQKGTYSTCHDFEYQVEGDATRATHAGSEVTEDHKELNRLLDAESGQQKVVDAERAKVKTAEAAVKRWDDTLARDAANPALNDEQRATRAKSYEKEIAKDKENLQKARERLAKAEAALAQTKAAEGNAFTHFVPGMTARPKRGDYIRIGFAEDRTYGANSKSTPAKKGDFLHVCVFDHLDVKDADTEIWTTIDGGGEKPAIGLANGPTTVKPKEAKIGPHLLLGWTNVANLVDEGLPGRGKPNP